MEVPLGWNQFRTWNFELEFCGVTSVFLLREHIFLVQDLVADWIDGPPGEFAYFIPINYAIRVSVENIRLHLPLNEQNVLDQITNDHKNGKWFISLFMTMFLVYMIITSEELTFNTNLDFRLFQPEYSSIMFTAMVCQLN